MPRRRGEREEAEQQGPAHATTFGRPARAGAESSADAQPFRREAAAALQRGHVWAASCSVQGRGAEPANRHRAQPPAACRACTPSPRRPPSSSPPTRPTAPRSRSRSSSAAARREAPLYCYRPLTASFIDERLSILGAAGVLPARRARARRVRRPGRLPRRARRARSRAEPRARAEQALRHFLARASRTPTDFVADRRALEPRLRGARGARLEGRARDRGRRADDGPRRSTPTRSPWATGSSLVRADALRGARRRAAAARGRGRPSACSPS